MSFICIDADSHKPICLRADRLNAHIKDFFIAHYSTEERGKVKRVVMDMNAAYQSLVPQLFPNAEIVIDRFHVIQLIGRALDQIRIQCLKSLSEHCRVRKALKNQWRLFHKGDLDAATPHYLRGLNEYMTEQNAVDLGLDAFPELKSAHEALMTIHGCLMKHNS
jgi:transposase